MALKYLPGGIVTSQSNLQDIGQDLTSTLSGFFLTAWRLPGDATEAEVLVVKAIEGLETGSVTSGSIRAAVIDRLVRIELSGRSEAVDDVFPRGRQLPNEGDANNEYEQTV